MAQKKIGIGGFELWIHANEKALTISGAIRNRLWRYLHSGLRALLKGASKKRRAPAEAAAATAPVGASPEAEALLERIRGIEWYHSIDLGHSVVTPGFFDHRDILSKYHLPERMDGLRVLDVATFDGFWAFEFEKRGAGEVVAIDVERYADLDLAPQVRAKLTDEKLGQRIGRGFETARELLQSKVRREVCSIYDLSPERLGKFDLVHVGDVLLHLMFPLKALQSVLSVTGRCAIISECYFPGLDQMGSECLMEYRSGTDECAWWRFSLGALENMVRDAGFETVERLSAFRFGPRLGPADLLHHVVLRAYPHAPPDAAG